MTRITSELVFKKLENLNVHKCPGLDGIHPKLLFELRKEISKPLSLLFSESLELGVVPVDWKDAGVTPLFKKGKKSEPANYRPISLTSIVCKVLESLLKDCIVSHLSKFLKIKNTKHGFTKNKLCLMLYSHDTSKSWQARRQLYWSRAVGTLSSVPS